MTLPTGRGRPPKFNNPVELPHLLHLFETADCSFSEVCRRARTTPHLVKQLMRASDMIEFEIRVACLRGLRKKRLGAGWGRPEIVLEAAIEAHRLGHGERGRSWEEVQESIRRRAEGPGLEGQGFETAMREPVVIPEAMTAEEEAF